MHVRSALAVTMALGCTVTGLVTIAAPAYAVDKVCETVDVTTPVGDTSRPSAPYALLGLPAAQDQVARFGPPLDHPVRVAVLSSGVQTGGGVIPLHGGADTSFAGGPIADPQGTEVAGLIAGAARGKDLPVGIAPGSDIVNVRVYVDRASDNALEKPSSRPLAIGLSWLAGVAADLNVKVAVVPFAVAASTDLSKAVKAVQKAGVVVVAAGGDRPEEGSAFSGDFHDPPKPDEDAGPLFFPAGYPGVVAVNATGDGDPSSLPDLIVKNSRTKVAAPSYNAVSYGLNGHTCLVQPFSAAAASGVVAGVVALLWQRFPEDRAAQIVARLTNTADGTTDDPTPLTGYGVVQPYEALTRPLKPSKTGKVERTVVRTETDTQATAPEPADDLLASTKENAVWWGLIGGGLLVVALMLRPVLARRRRA